MPRPTRRADRGPARIGYARVSTDDQNLDLQRDALSAAGCCRIFCDEGISGVAADRPALAKALAALEPGDVLITWKLDRLGRSLAHLIDIVRLLEDRSVGFQSLSEAIDTTTAGGMLLFHVMGALAEFERALISERTKAGMASARDRGRVLGRPSKLTCEQAAEIRQAFSGGQESIGTIAARFDVSASTIRRTLRSGMH